MGSSGSAVWMLGIDKTLPAATAVSASAAGAPAEREGERAARAAAEAHEHEPGDRNPHRATSPSFCS